MSEAGAEVQEDRLILYWDGRPDQALERDLCELLKKHRWLWSGSGYGLGQRDMSFHRGEERE